MARTRTATAKTSTPIAQGTSPAGTPTVRVVLGGEATPPGRMIQLLPGTGTGGRTSSVQNGVMMLGLLAAGALGGSILLVVRRRR